MFCCFGQKEKNLKVLFLQICICAALLFPSVNTFQVAFVVSLHPGSQPNASNFHFCPLKAPQRRLAGALGHWAFGPPSLPLLCVGQRKRELLYPALPILGPSLPHHPLPPARYLRRAFKCSLKGKKKQKGKKSETVLFQALNSMALASLSSHDTTLLLSSLFLGVSLNLFFYFFFISQCLTAFFFWHFLGVRVALAINQATTFAALKEMTNMYVINHLLYSFCI